MKFLKNNILLLIINGFNLLLLGFLLFNYYMTYSNTVTAADYKALNTKNSQYLVKVSKLLSSKQSSFDHYNNFVDDYIFESPTEALILRETLEGKGIDLPEYLIKQEVKPILDIQKNKVHYLQLMYRFDEINFKDAVLLIDYIANNNKYDYLNNIYIGRLENNLISMSFDYSNMGMLVY